MENQLGTKPFFVFVKVSSKCSYVLGNCLLGWSFLEKLGENNILTNAKFDGGSVMRVMTISDDGSTDTNRTNRKTNGMMHIKHDNNICNLNISKFGVGK